MQERCVVLNCMLSATGLQGMLPHSQQYHLLPPIIRVTISRDVPINYGNIFISGTGREGSSGNASTGLFIRTSGISELDCATTKTDTAERSISIGRESLQVFFVLGALAYFHIPPLRGSREEKWRSQ